MPIRIYNSLTRQKEEFVPLNKDGKTVNMYTCGVTVYDQCHIGHARSLYVFDVIRRYLAYRGFAVHFVRNITDVDDKILNRAKELKKSFDQVVDENIAGYYRDMDTLGIARADQEPRATQNIPEMIKHIEGLIKSGEAYAIDGDVYFSVREFKDYGKLSHQNIDQMKDAVRIENDPRKKDPLDFALWKKAKEGEKSWPSPWGEGRPGWHIECSVMSMKYLKTEMLDIHAGGRDLIFPHHENEVAQSEALTKKQFAKYWIHHGLLTINGQKMAKSLGNFITIQDALKKYDVDVLKLFFLASHYASPIDYSEDKLSDAKKAHDRIKILIEKFKREGIAPGNSVETANLKEFIDAMDDDFNTPKALAALFILVNDCNKLQESQQSAKTEGLSNIKLMTELLGLKFFAGTAREDLSPEVDQLIKDRVQARAQKDFKKSDELRDLLKGRGIAVEDTKDGQVWRRI